MDKRKNLKKYINKKFGSLSRFARILGKDTIDFHNSLKKDENIEGIYKLAKNTKDEPVKGRELTDDLSNLIRIKIYSNYRNISAFSASNPKYSISWLSNVINGKTGGYDTKRKLITTKIKSLCKELGIEL